MESGSCVSSCLNWVKNTSTLERECVSKCPYTYLQHSNGYCEPQTKKLIAVGVGIFGTVVLVVEALAMCLCCYPKGVRTARAADRSEEEGLLESAAPAVVESGARSAPCVVPAAAVPGSSAK